MEGELRGFGYLKVVTLTLFSPEEAGRSALQKHARLWPVLGEAWLSPALQQRREDDAHLSCPGRWCTKHFLGVEGM